MGSSRQRSSVKMENQIVPNTIGTALVSALLEWFLIFLLFIDASFSYLVTKFARYCQLQIPCLLCSRLDHVLGKEKTEFYWDLLCHNHKLKISSLIICHRHENLVDVHGICESCLFSFATINKSNAETYRQIVGKLGNEPRFGLLPNFQIADDISNSLEGRKCTCCNDKFISRRHVEMLCHTKRIGYQETDFVAPLVAANRHDRDEIEDSADLLFPNIKSSSMQLDVDHLQHVEYQKVKATSDTESTGHVETYFNEPLLAAIGHENDGPREFIDVSSMFICGSVTGKDKIDSLVHVEYEKVKSTSDTESVGYEASDPDAPLLMINGIDRNIHKNLEDNSSKEVKPSQAGKKKDIDHLLHVEYEKVKITSDTESEACFSDKDSTGSPVHVLNDRNQNFFTEYRENDLVVGNLASEVAMNPCDVSQPPKLDTQIPAEPTDLHTSPALSDQVLEKLKCQHIEHNADAVKLQLISLNDIFPSNAAQSSTNVPAETFDLKAVGKLGSAATREIDEIMELSSDMASANDKQSDLKYITSDSSSQIVNILELGDAYKLAVGSRGRQLSGKLLEQKSFKDSTRVSEDFKLLLSQLSSVRGIELQINDMSPRVSGNIDELRTDTSCSIGMQILQKRMSLERNESGISLDGSTISEIEGESAVDRLKRQVEHDKKLMGALYKELEEERNASTVAANQTMAMITRLQEEKATLHMEALQCLRMMEEQAEYDAEALQNATDLLVDKEKEIQNLEAELEAYKKMSGCTSQAAYLSQPNCDLNTSESSVEKFEASLKQSNTTLSSSKNIMCTAYFKPDDTSGVTSDEVVYLRKSFAFEEESLNILQCLKELEKKIEVFSNSDSLSDTANGNFSEEKSVKMMGNWKQNIYKCGNVENEECKIEMKNSVVNTESCSASEESDSLHMDPGSETKVNGELKSEKNFYTSIDFQTLRNEFLVLNNRLKALEMEHSFLKYSTSSICSKGDEGLKFIHEMASQVRELHTLGIRNRN